MFTKSSSFKPLIIIFLHVLIFLIFGSVKNRVGDFPGDPVARILRSSCRGPGFAPWTENWIPHVTTKILHASWRPRAAKLKTKQKTNKKKNMTTGNFSLIIVFFHRGVITVNFNLTRQRCFYCVSAWITVVLYYNLKSKLCFW